MPCWQMSDFQWIEILLVGLMNRLIQFFHSTDFVMIELELDTEIIRHPPTGAYYFDPFAIFRCRFVSRETVKT